MDKPAFIRRDEIDILKWDKCIEGACNSLVYAQSKILDALHPGWDALICGDYDFVMPLTWRRKFAIRYLCQPPFSQQLGIFGAHPASASTIAAFLAEIQARFRFVDIRLNYLSPFIGSVEKTNRCLEMHRYGDVAKNYSVKLRQHLKKALSQNLVYAEGPSVTEVISRYRRLLDDKQASLPPADLVRFSNACSVLQSSGMVIVRQVKDRDGKACAMCIFWDDGRRIYNLASVVSESGRSLRANHLLFDSLIREFAGSGKVLDFEGSDIPGIDGFYRSFGAERQPYYMYRYNNLPFPLNLLKK